MNTELEKAFDRLETEIDLRFEDDSLDEYKHGDLFRLFILLKIQVQEALTQSSNQLIEKVKALPTGMFDSTPYKEKLLKELEK